MFIRFWKRVTLFSGVRLNISTRGVLYSLLRHPVYLGKISFRDEIHEGQHVAILDPKIWQQAQNLLDTQAHSTNGHYGKSRGMLQGRLQDLTGKRYWSTAAERQKGRQLRYYYQKKTRHRIPARDIEPIIIAALHLPDVMNVLLLNEEQQHQWELRMTLEPQRIAEQCITRIVLGEHTTRVVLDNQSIHTALAVAMTPPESKIPAHTPYEAFPDFTLANKDEALEIELQYSFLHKVKSVALRSKHNETLLAAIGSAWRWERMLRENPALDQKQLADQEKVDTRYLQRALNLLFLAPDILTSILNGTQPDHLTMDSFKTINLPVCWKAQRKLLRIPS